MVAITLHVLLREFAEVDPGLQFRVDGNGYLTVGHRHLEVELLLQQAALEAQGIVVGDNLMDVVFGCIEL